MRFTPTYLSLARSSRLCFPKWRAFSTDTGAALGKIRNRIFYAWFRFRRPKTLGVRAIVENQDGQVLLVRHTYTKGLHFPGGGVEPRETALQSLIRELQEEGGVDLTGTPDIIQIYANERYFPNDHVVFYRVRSENWRPCKTNNLGEISEIVWADPLNPPEDTTPGTRRRINEVYRGADIDPLW